MNQRAWGDVDSRNEVRGAGNGKPHPRQIKRTKSPLTKKGGSQIQETATRQGISTDLECRNRQRERSRRTT